MIEPGEIARMAVTVMEQRSRSYVNDCHVFARWIYRLQHALPDERLAMMSRDLDGLVPGEPGKPTE